MEGINGGPSPATEPTPIEVGGFRLVPSKTTSFRQDARIMELAVECGLLDVIDVARREGEITAAATEIVQKVYAGNRVPRLLSGLLIVEGEKWSPARADEVAEALADVSDPAVKHELMRVTNECILYFFLRGAASSGLSLNSLRDDAEPEASATSAARPNGEQLPSATSPRADST